MLRTEHPNPQFKRKSYECLNGTWGFETGKGEGKKNVELSSVIQVPFCPESALSGIGNTDFITDCVYTRLIDVSPSDLEGRLAVHFNAVDHTAEVYLNGEKAGVHEGGYTPFECDLAPFARVGKNRLTVCVHDDVRENVPSGKQSKRRESFGCFYTRTTGIWQTVWLERTPKKYIRSVRFFPDPDSGSVRVETTVEGGGEMKIRILYEGREVGRACGEIYYRHIFDVPLSEIHLWEAGKGRLYDVEFTYGEDEVESYFGLRSAKFEGRKFLLNGKSVFQRLVLDQGYYPQGVYTAPSAAALEKDIRLSLALGFNGARLHQKLFEPLFLYYCDKMGYMVWGEYGSWGIEYEDLEALGRFTSEWTEAVQRDFNHPSVVVWCPLNEVWENLEDSKKIRDVRFVEAIYKLTKTLDPTRPCVDTSGGYHGRYTDLFDFHCYHEPERLAEHLRAIEERDVLTMDKTYAPPAAQEEIPYDGLLPINASEYGGVAYGVNGNGWGYRTGSSEEEFVDGYVKLTELLLRCGKLSGFCYTQLYDVEQEQNGLYTFDREPKLSESAMKRIAACNGQTAEIEKEKTKESSDREAWKDKREVRENIF